MADWDFILAPPTVEVEIKFDEVAIIINMLRMINAEEFHSGLHEWIPKTAAALDEERLNLNFMVCNFVDPLSVDKGAKTFPEFIQKLSSTEPQQIIDVALHWLRQHKAYPGDEVMLASKENYLHYIEIMLAEKYAAKGEELHLDKWEKEYDYIQQPELLVEKMTEHLQYMWDNYVESEWKRVKPIVHESVEAFKEMDYAGMSAYEAIETITGRNMRNSEYFENKMDNRDHLIFIPHAHLGPYISWGASPDDNTIVFFFGARAPKGAKTRSNNLSRSELLVRLNALADETRLKILELLTQHDELCAQDFINELDLSQSSASRHLRQLTASGYVSERRRDVAKCYSLNPERIDDTIRSLKEFLNKE